MAMESVGKNIAVSQAAMNSATVTPEKVSSSTFAGRIYSNLESLKSKFEYVTDLFKDKIEDIKSAFSSKKEAVTEKVVENPVFNKNISSLGKERLNADSDPALLEPIATHRGFKNNDAYEGKPEDKNNKSSDSYSNFDNNSGPTREAYSRVDSYSNFDEKAAAPPAKETYSKVESYSNFDKGSTAPNETYSKIDSDDPPQTSSPSTEYANVDRAPPSDYQRSPTTEYANADRPEPSNYVRPEQTQDPPANGRARATHAGYEPLNKNQTNPNYSKLPEPADSPTEYANVDRAPPSDYQRPPTTEYANVDTPKTSEYVKASPQNNAPPSDYQQFSSTESRTSNYSQVPPSPANDYKRTDSSNVDQSPRTSEYVKASPTLANDYQPTQPGIVQSSPRSKYVKFNNPNETTRSPPQLIKARSFASRIYSRLVGNKEVAVENRNFSFKANIGKGSQSDVVLVNVAKTKFDAHGNEVKVNKERVLVVPKQDEDLKNAVQINQILHAKAKEAKNNGQDALPNVLIAKAISFKNEIVFQAKYMAGGTVLSNIGKSSTQQLRSMAAGMARGVQQLHKNGILHRDIKADNFLVTPDGTVKIADMGKAIERGKGTSTNLFRSAVPPELKKSADWNEKMDIYQLGVAIFQTLTGTTSFSELEDNMIGDVVTRDRSNSNELRKARDQNSGSWKGMEKLDPETRAMVTRMTDSDPNKRPSADEVAAFFE
jgi:ribosomal protein L21